MDEQNSKNDTPKKDKSTRPLYDSDDSIQQAKEDSYARQPDGGQPEHRARGWSWYKLLTLIATFLYKSLALLIPSALGLAAVIVAVWQWQVDQVDTIAVWQKDRARVIHYDTRDIQIEPDPALSFSLIFKNVGETTALNTYGARLQGECPRTSSQECIQWCLQPLRKEQGKGYGPLISKDEYKEEVFYVLKTGKKRKKKLPVYFCGYFAYTDVFCVWRRKFYVLSYDPSAEQLSTYSLEDDEDEAQAQNCSQ